MVELWRGRDVVFDNKMCRLCGCASGRFYNVTEHHPTEESLLSMIKRLVPIPIQEKDRKPQQVCSSCLTKIEEYNNFVSMCLAMDLTFNNILDNFKLELSEDKVVEGKSIKPNETNNVLVVTRTDNGVLENSNVYFMLELNYKGVSVDPLLVKYNEEEEDGKINEEECNRKREKSKHFTCSVCNKSLKRKRNLIAHLAVHSSERPHKCKNCTKTFITVADLKAHSHIHTGAYSCTDCGRAFAAKSKLERHKKTHSGLKDHTCPVCKKSFSDKNNMLAHTRIHTGERPFHCSVCKKTFRTKSHYKDHKRSHSSMTPFKCPTCGKSFKWNSNLKDHAKVHTGEKYQCCVCNKEFNVKSDLYKHRKGCKENITCSVCLQLFTDSGTYQSHMLNVHHSDFDFQLRL